MNDVTISVKDVTKIYKLYDKPTDRLKEVFLKKNMHKDFYAVNGVSFDVHKGETVGIIGKNGSGKSTLLKMVTGVLTPSSGEISLAGPVSALLELGTGFDGEQDGISNIYLNGNMVGLSKEEIDASLQDIIDFADIGDFIHQPVKTYSSGMFVRLAFAVAINIKPEILIVDEALSVGDIRFQQKCYRKIKEFRENGTVLFVSHDTSAIASFCDRVIWLNDGEIYKVGKPEEILQEYMTFMRYDITNGGESEQKVVDNEASTSEAPDTTLEDDNNPIEEVSENDIVTSMQFGNYDAKFVQLRLLNEQGKEIEVVWAGQKVMIEMTVQAEHDIKSPIFGFVIKDRLGNEIVATNTVMDQIDVKEIKAGKTSVYRWKFSFPEFHADEYPVDIALADGTYQVHQQVHFLSDAMIIKCVDDRMYQEGRGRYILKDASFEKVK